jgi:hypothetical protein
MVVFPSAPIYIAVIQQTPQQFSNAIRRVEGIKEAERWPAR